MIIKISISIKHVSFDGMVELRLEIVQTGCLTAKAHSRIMCRAPHKKSVHWCCYRYCSRLLVSGTKLTDICFFCVTLPSVDLSYCSSFWLPLWLPTGTSSRPVPGLSCSINYTLQTLGILYPLYMIFDHVFKNGFMPSEKFKRNIQNTDIIQSKSVASLGAGGRPPRVTPSKGVIP